MVPKHRECVLLSKARETFLLRIESGNSSVLFLSEF